jgi:hypothetical protein
MAETPLCGSVRLLDNSTARLSDADRRCPTGKVLEIHVPVGVIEGDVGETPNSATRFSPTWDISSLY